MIHIIKDLYLIKFDERNYALIKGSAPKDPKKGYGNRIHGYYGSIQPALKKALDFQLLAGADGVQLQEIINAINELNKRIDELKWPHIMKSFGSVK